MPPKKSQGIEKQEGHPVVGVDEEEDPTLEIELRNQISKLRCKLIISEEEREKSVREAVQERNFLSFYHKDIRNKLPSCIRRGKPN
ncbi:hypothetical protein DPMN_135442 [Dreissena polymorpha]|uniref:Uncharacterized protein n=1 Tax=Dreissena polymorpha TaxID=45954 RepID=A0A9D4JEP1_DREPO|nr:hypothetical protein DPMN_135442 [Dreissena polymorpha]